jgi:hypothetical protein
VLLLALPIVAGLGADSALILKYPSETMDSALFGALVAHAAAHIAALVGVGVMLFSAAQLLRRVDSWFGRTSELGVALGAVLGLLVFDQLAFGAAFTGHRFLPYLRFGFVGSSACLVAWRILRPARFLSGRRWPGLAGVGLAAMLFSVVVCFGGSLFPMTPKYLRELIQAQILGLSASAWLLFALSSPTLPWQKCAAALAVGLAFFVGGISGASRLSHRSTNVIVTTTEFVRSLRNANRHLAHVARIGWLREVGDLVARGKTPIRVASSEDTDVTCSRTGSPPLVRSVLLLTFDALRADFYGVPPQERPNFATLAASSLEFVNALQTTSGTSGSIFSHHVGRYPDQPSPTRDLFPAVAGALGLRYVPAFQGSQEPNTKFTERLIGQIEASPSGFLIHAHYLALHLPSGVLRSQHRYPEILRQLDAELGRVLQSLEELGLENHTLLIVTADHGEELPHERGYESHGYGNTQTLLHTPLLLRAPGVPPARRNELVSGTDVFPTILDALNVRCDCPTHGQTLLKKGGRGPDGPVFASSMGPNPAVPELYYSDIHSVLLGSWKLVVNRGESAAALYHLSTDPHERRNLADQEPAKFAQMASLLNWHLNSRQ